MELFAFGVPCVARRCARWIGTDVSPNMLRWAAESLRDLPNVEFVELPGFDLRPIASKSVDFVYCTVVFPHLSQWDRYSYVEEAFRVLRPGPVDFMSITSIFVPNPAGRFSKRTARFLRFNASLKSGNVRPQKS